MRRAEYVLNHDVDRSDAVRLDDGDAAGVWVFAADDLMQKWAMREEKGSATLTRSQLRWSSAHS